MFKRIRIFAGLSIIFIVFCVIGCTSTKDNAGSIDETGKKVIIGYVNTEEFYLVSIEQRRDDVLSWLRSERSIFFQPSPEDLIRLAYICLKREIRKAGMEQPGMVIDRDEKRKISTEMAMGKANKIAEKLRQGGSFEDVSNEFKVSIPVRPQTVSKGDNPDYDDLIFNAEEGSIVGPLESDDRALVFKVVKVGKNEDGLPSADIFTISVMYPDEEAQRILEDRLSKNWHVRIVNGFYSAVDKYYSGDFEGAKSDLNSYVRKEGIKIALAHYLMFKILIKDYESKKDPALLDQAYASLRKSVDVSNDMKLTPYFQYYLGKALLAKGQGDEAKTLFRTAFDTLRSDLYLAEQLLNAFNETGDSEYAEKAIAKKSELEEQIAAEQAMKPRKTKSKPVVMTGEGRLYEDPEEIWNEKESKSDPGEVEGGGDEEY